MSAGTLDRENLRQLSHLQRNSVRGWSMGPSSWLRSPTVWTAVALGTVTLVLRLSYAASQPTDAVGSGLVAGSNRFDVRRGSPPASGSWLYVSAGHLVHVVVGLSPVHSLVLVAAVASAAATGLTCAAGTALGGRFVGLAAGALVVSAPVAWFAGSTVSTGSVDAAVGALLVVLACRARPYRRHGVVAVVVLGLGAGVQLSALPAFALLAAVAVVASVRTVGQLLAVVVAAGASVAAWFVPVIVIQPGGSSAWFHFLHLEFSHIVHRSSVFVAPSTAAVTNVGTFGAWSLVTLGPLIVLALVAIVVLAGARIATRQPGGDATLRIWHAGQESRDRTERPWYQARGLILLVALVPPVAVVTLVRFNGGGAVLFYLVPAAVALLLPVARLLHHRAAPVRHGAFVVAVVVLAGTVTVNVQRFVAAPGIMPASVIHHYPRLWISQARYGAPYADTAHTIRVADGARRSAP